MLSQYYNILVPTCNRGEIFSVLFLCKGDNAITNFCTLVTVHILVSEIKASSNGLCMTPYNMALANFLFAPLRVDLTTFLTNSIDVKRLDG